MEGEEFMVKGDRNCQDREGAEGKGWGREKEREKQSLLDNATHAYPIPSCKWDSQPLFFIFC